MRSIFGSTITRVIGSSLVSKAIIRCTPHSLRVLAYHGIDDSDSFAAHLEILGRSYTIVDGEDVVESLNGGRELPKDALWITFDDGIRTVIANGLPLLSAKGIPATLFISPGLASGPHNPWWEIVAEAVSHGWSSGKVSGESAIQTLKRVPDLERRELVASALHYVEAGGHRSNAPMLADVSDLKLWLNDGFEIGNHTWDHPCLGQCTASEQRDQILQADVWLRDFGAFSKVKLFAYPNGDWTSEAEQVLRELGYDVGLRLDHRRAPLRVLDPLRLSRLRIDATARPERLRAIASGAHSGLFATRRWRSGGRGRDE